MIVRKGEKRLAYVATYLKKVAIYGRKVAVYSRTIAVYARTVAVCARKVAPYELKGATDSIMFAVYDPKRATNTPSGCRL